jgi:murein DD-endopeptidase MepM/ murein hydrolase activator NlpD
MINRPHLAKNPAAFNLNANANSRSIDVTPVNGTHTSDINNTAAQASTEAANSIINSAPSPSSQTKRNSGNAGFIMGLNNRLTKQESRLNKIESQLALLARQNIHYQAANDRPIGYRELVLTFLLSVLVFTSLALVFTTPTSKQDLEFKILEQLDPSSQAKQTNAANTDISFLSRFISHPGIKSWLSSTKQSLQPVASNYKWPLERRLKTQQLEYSTYKHGINLPAKLGDPVVAIANGTVLFSDNNIANYGNLILVQHENDVISVYGNNYSNYVKKGQLITKGELIAAVGETAGNQPRLYFEIRYQGKAQDPFLYFQ